MAQRGRVVRRRLLVEVMCMYTALLQQVTHDQKVIGLCRQSSTNPTEYARNAVQAMMQCSLTEVSRPPAMTGP
jgi:hypothetical protein